MKTPSLPTQFAPAERCSDEELSRQVERFQNDISLRVASDAAPSILLVLNQNRQIVYGNRRLMEMFHQQDLGFAVGQRPGELFACIHAIETQGGCGTTEFCRTCGAAIAILNGLNGKADVQECRILQQSEGDALDLRVYATPLKVEGETYTFFSISDISSEKRRDVLERVFFHDVMNTAGGLHGMLSLLETTSDSQQAQAIQKDLLKVSADLIDEIAGQRQLLAAEKNEMVVDPTRLHSRELIGNLISAYQAHPVANGKRIALDEQTIDCNLVADKSLLARVLGNMLKNGLEASGEGDVVTIGCQSQDNTLRFWVHNPRYMPRAIQLQIFQRSFSTKGTGRGLGTYSMKLLGERYLKGKVSFTSTPDEGTTFFVDLPQSAPAEAKSQPVAPRAAEAQRILVADDNAFMRTVLQNVLKKMGHAVTCVSDGLEVLSSLKSAEYDVILMDGQMPHMDGAETTRQIRASQLGGPHLRIIALTADGMPGDRERYLAMGMNGYLTKPIQPDELRKILSE